MQKGINLVFDQDDETPVHFSSVFSNRKLHVKIQLSYQPLSMRQQNQQILALTKKSPNVLCLVLFLSRPGESPPGTPPLQQSHLRNKKPQDLSASAGRNVLFSWLHKQRDKITRLGIWLHVFTLQNQQL